MEFTSKVKNKNISGQTREVVANVLQYFKGLASKYKEIKEFQQVQKCVVTATGVSLRSVQTIAKEMRAIEDGEKSSFTSPSKKKLKLSPKTCLDDFDEGVLRRYIAHFYITEKKVPTLKGILHKCINENGYTGSRESIRRVLKKIGYRWVKTRTNRKLLMEKPDIQLLRLNYLRQIKRFRADGRPIVYMDETYIHSSHTHKKAWSDASDEGLLSPISKGQRLIILGAGNEKGFVPNSYLRFKSNSKTGDYHHDMNFQNYTKWIQEKLIPNLEPRTVLVIDNAPYHNVQKDKCPNMSSRKDEMKQWLSKNNVPFTDDMLKADLYNLVKLYKPTIKSYAIDEILNSHGHDVLRLPPYHPDLNPIELVWASMKQYVGDRNVQFNLSSVEKLCDEFFLNFSAEEWTNRCTHSQKVEKLFIEQEPLLDTVIDSLIITLQGDESDTESESDSDSDISDTELL